MRGKNLITCYVYHVQAKIIPRSYRQWDRGRYSILAMIRHASNSTWLNPSFHLLLVVWHRNHAYVEQRSIQFYGITLCHRITESIDSLRQRLNQMSSTIIS